MSNVAESLLYGLARILYRTEVAHSDAMKSALANPRAYAAHRALEVNRIAAAVKTYGLPLAGKTVVDLGCNDGAISAEYLKQGAANVVGLDIDAAAIDRARKTNSDERLQFLESKTDRIPLADRSVEVVISYDVFEHIANPPQMLAELRRILKDDGVVLIGTSGWLHPFAPHLWSIMPVPWAHVLFSERTLLRACRRIYLSKWYRPTMHDFDAQGNRRQDKFTHEVISPDYLNKYLIRDFESAFQAAGFRHRTHLVPFQAKAARWVSQQLSRTSMREYVVGYVWFELRPQ